MTSHTILAGTYTYTYNFVRPVIHPHLFTYDNNMSSISLGYPTSTWVYGCLGVGCKMLLERLYDHAESIVASHHCICFLCVFTHFLSPQSDLLPSLSSLSLSVLFFFFIVSIFSCTVSLIFFTSSCHLLASAAILYRCSHDVGSPNTWLGGSPLRNGTYFMKNKVWTIRD